MFEHGVCFSFLDVCNGGGWFIAIFRFEVHLDSVSVFAKRLDEVYKLGP